MKFGGEMMPVHNDQKQEPEVKQEASGVSRRDFLKKITKFGLGSLLAGSPLSALAFESNEKPPIVNRATWDDHWSEIQKEYKVSLGEKYDVYLNGVLHKKTADVLPYYNESFINTNGATLEHAHRFEDLKNVYRRCAIHHTDASTAGLSTYSQVRSVRDSEMGGKQNFNDVGYHFLIAADGTILEGRPSGRVGSNAGESKETDAYYKKHLPRGVVEVAEAKGNSSLYYEKLRHYIRAMKMDPDYGTLGIVLCGDFDNGAQPSAQQQASLVKLLNWAKKEYEIPTNNIIYHNEVKKRVVEDSGLTFGGKYDHTVCPGRTFPAISNFTSKLKPDTQKALTKTILLDKFY